MRSRSIVLALAMCAAALTGIQLHGALAPDEQTSSAIASLSNSRCSKAVCGKYIESSCQPESDGPIYYLKVADNPTWLPAAIGNWNADLVLTCSFWTGCRTPDGSKGMPPEWTCIREKPAK